MRHVIVITLFCVVIGHLAVAARIKIDVHQSDAVIRTQLLQLTRPGTPIREVDQFYNSGCTTRAKLWAAHNSDKSRMRSGQMSATIMSSGDCPRVFFCFQQLCTYAGLSTKKVS